MSFFIAGLIVFFVIIMFSVSNYENFQIAGVTFAPEHGESEQVKKIQRKFKLEETVIGALFILVSFAGQLEIFQGRRDFVQLIVLFAYLFIAYVPLMLLQKRLMQLKQDNNWIYETHKRAADLSVTRERGKAAPNRRWIWLIWLFSWLPLIIALIIGSPWPIILPLLIVPVSMIMSPLTYPKVIQTRIPFVSKDSEVTLAYARKYERIAGMSYILLMLTVVLFFNLLMTSMLYRLSSSWLIGLLIVFSIVLLGLLWNTANKNRTLQAEFFDKTPWHLEDSQGKYKWGGYYDPADPRLFVPKRTPGMGFTVNVGRPAGKIIAGVLGAVLIGVIAMALVMATASFEVDLTSDYIHIDVPMYGTQIDFRNVEEIQLSQESLSGTRTNGFGGQEKSFGYFSLNHYGPVKLFVYNDNPAHIAIQLSEEQSSEWVIINQLTIQETEELYQHIRAAWESSER